MGGMTQQPTSLSEVNELRRSGELSADKYLGAVQDVRDAVLWYKWAVRTLAFLGGAHLLAGVVFFFAYNWDDLAPFAKFAILQGAILVSFASALFVRLDSPLGEGLLIATSVFTGVLFAVIGQVYQTGADAWELFAAWALLILPWAIASKSSAHWMLWVIIVITAVGLFGEQVLAPLGKLTYQQVITVVGAVVVVLAFVRESAISLGAIWLDDRWFQIILIMIGLGSLFMPALSYVFETHRGQPGFFAFAVSALLMFGFYFRVRPSFPAVAVVAGFTALLLMAIGGRGIHEVVGFDWNGALPLITSLTLLVAWCVGVSATLVRVLNTLNAQVGAGATNE